MQGKGGGRTPLGKWLRPPVPWKTFFKDLYKEIDEDGMTNGAAALAYFLMLAIFPATIFLLSLLPYLPIPHVDQAIMDLLRQSMPPAAADLFTETVTSVVSTRREGLLSLGALGTLWAAMTGMKAVMDQLNVTYDVLDSRPFWKTRAIALMLVGMLGVLVISAFGLIVFGGVLQDKIAEVVGYNQLLLVAFVAFRWGVILAMLLTAFSITYYFGPDVEQDFKFITPGALMGTIILIGAALGFRLYVENFGAYEATYGSVGAVIVMLLWLYVMGNVILLGSEVNALFEHYAEGGKNKGEKDLPA